MTQHVADFVVSVEHIDGYEFRVRFDKEQYEEVLADEPAPLGHDAAPNAARYLAAAIGNCLSASLLFCAHKAKTELAGLKSEVRVDLVRNEHKRLRIGGIDVKLMPELAAGDLGPCLGAFEDFCVVTESVREGIDVNVSVQVSDASKSKL
ncbi:MAG TPA: OsmC family protein [Polyangiaceae bacterium]|jgi:uncharacterized OsmC-like protein